MIVTVACAVLGYPVAYAAARLRRPWDVAVLACVVLPFWTSVLVRTYAWLVLLQRTGLVNQALAGLGVVDEPLALVHNEFGTVVAMVHILLPFMVLPLYAAMTKIPMSEWTAKGRLIASFALCGFANLLTLDAGAALQVSVSRTR